MGKKKTCGWQRIKYNRRSEFEEKYDIFNTPSHMHPNTKHKANKTLLPSSYWLPRETFSAPSSSNSWNSTSQGSSPLQLKNSHWVRVLEVQAREKETNQVVICDENTQRFQSKFQPLKYFREKMQKAGSAHEVCRSAGTSEWRSRLRF